MPSGLTATAHTASVASVSARCSSAADRSHSRMAPSSLAEATCRPSGRTATASTSFMCPWNDRVCLPEESSHSRTVLSRLPVTRNLPSGLRASAWTESPWPTKSRSRVAVLLVVLPSGLGPAVSRAFPSLPQVRMPPASGVNATPSASPLDSTTDAAMTTGLGAPGTYTVSIPVLSTAATSFPLGLYATFSIRTARAGLANVSLPVSTAYTRTTPSSPPTASNFPSGLNATPLIGLSAFSSRTSTFCCLPVAGSHRWTWLPPAVATDLPSGAKATSATASTLASLVGSLGWSAWPR